MDTEIEARIEKAAFAVAEGDALLITAGAGRGVDSGLPDFRGDKGFWKAYPPFERLGVSFVDMANPGWFSRDPGWPGASTATGSSSTAKPRRIAGSRF